MKSLISSVVVMLFLVGCGSSSVQGGDPYPGSGGLYLGTPSKADIESGRAVFDPAKFSSFQVGTTTKREVVAALGEPANWKSNPDGTSELGYNYVAPEPSAFRRIKEARFTFNRNYVLSGVELPDFGK
jgi:hypothetical protein